MTSENQKDVTISIIVPVYRVEAYLESCVRSILAQTFSDFELLLVDDGSPDRCPELCEELAKEDLRIKVIHQENQGQAAARNNALAYTSGEWICYVDSDDAVHPELLESLLLEARKSGARIVGCDRVEAESPPKDFFAHREPSFIQIQVDEDALEELYRVDSPAYWCVWGKLIAREIVCKLQLTPGRFYEDNAIMCQWLVEAGQISVTGEPMYFYRINSSGTTKSAFSLKRTDFLWALQEQLQFYRKLKYHRMEAVIATGFLTNSHWLYYPVRDELHNLEKARKIRRDAAAVYRKYRKKLLLPQKKQDEYRDWLSLFVRGRRKAKALIKKVVHR